MVILGEGTQHKTNVNDEAIFHWKLRLRRLPNMKKTGETMQSQPLCTQREPYSTGSRWVLLWVIVTRVGSMGARVGSRRIHVGFSNGKWAQWGSKSLRRLNASGFVLQWNIDKSIENNIFHLTFTLPLHVALTLPSRSFG